LNAVADLPAWNAAAELDVLRPHVEARILAWIDKLPRRDLYHTRGLNANGTTQDNSVARMDLANHIEYNLTFRPGRALFVHGICVNTGGLKPALLLATAESLMFNPVAPGRCNAPYH